MYLMLNLTKANKLIEQIAASNEFITPVTLDDFELFQSFFDKEPHSYGNSWTYVTQGVYGIGPNNLGYKYYDGENLSMICVYPKIEDPETNVFYWIRPMGKDVVEKIVKFSEEILKKHNVYSYVKKLFKKDFERISSKGFSVVDKFPWHSLAPSEDDTFPEQILDIKKTLRAFEEESKRKNVRKSYIKSLKIESEKKVSLSDSNFEEDAWIISEEYFKSSNIRGSKTNFSSKYDYYNLIFQNNSDNNLKKGVLYLDDAPYGYYFGEKNASGYFSLYAMLTLWNKIDYLSDYIVQYILNELSNTSKYFNFGGSEEIGMHKFKKKYLPVKSQKMYWATNFS